MIEPLILGTRGSDLALAQANMTRDALAAAGVECRIEVIKTIGDKRPDLKLIEFSQGENAVLDKGIFTKELEEALLRGEIDFAVHSLKDVPTELGDGFEICATLPRAAIPDVLLTLDPGFPEKLSDISGKVIATSSVRRARQLKWLCDEVDVVDIRGNVPTRVRKLTENSEWDAILLARAGLERLGIYDPAQSTFEFKGHTVQARELPEDEFLPAAGQGAVAMEIRSENSRAREALALINHEATFQRIDAERAFLAALKAGCQTPVGVYTWFEDDGASLVMSVQVFNEEDPSTDPFVAEVKGAASAPESIAAELMNLKDQFAS
jgi:hydroxymethylbilane synthase|tara:strand:- start:22 stop:990 length:969 start_codon:yes stop_codon:yes gene_type:complete